MEKMQQLLVTLFKSHHGVGKNHFEIDVSLSVSCKYDNTSRRVKAIGELFGFMN